MNTRSDSRQVFLWAGIVFIFTFILYGNTLNHSYAADDDSVIRNNTFVQQGFQGIPSLFSHTRLYGFNKTNDGSYRPVPMATFAIETAVWGEKPSIRHFFNILLYALSGVLLLFLMKRIFRDRSLTVPVVIVLLFLAHPVHTEAVANIKSRDEILSFLFLMTMLLGLLRYHDTGKPAALVVSALCCFGSLLSKESALAYVALVPLVLFYFTDSGWKKILALSLVYAAIAGIYLGLRGMVLDSVASVAHLTVLNNGLLAAPDVAHRLATAILILGKYLLLLIFPHPLSWDYSYHQVPIVTFSNPFVLITIALYLGMAVYSVIRLRSKHISGFCFLFYIITLSIVSNLFILIATTMAERFLFTPSLAFCIILAFLLSKITGAEQHPAVFKHRAIFLGSAAVLLSLYSFKTVSRNSDWKNNETLFAADAESAPNSTTTQAALAYVYLGKAQADAEPAEKQRYFALSEQFFVKSLEIYPQNDYALYNYGVLEAQMGKMHDAELLFRKATLVNPEDANAWNNLSVTAMKLEHYDSAIVYYKGLLRFDTSNSRVLGVIGAICQYKGDFARAVEYDKKALVADPANDAVYGNMIALYAALKDTSNMNYYLRERAKHRK